MISRHSLAGANLVCLGYEYHPSEKVSAIRQPGMPRRASFDADDRTAARSCVHQALGSRSPCKIARYPRSLECQRHAPHEAVAACCNADQCSKTESGDPEILYVPRSRPRSFVDMARTREKPAAARRLVLFHEGPSSGRARRPAEAYPERTFQDA